MVAWETSSPKGNLRAVLNTIFSSELFRSHAAAAQKIKTPLEFVASSLRALRSVNPDGTATATTDALTTLGLCTLAQKTSNSKWRGSLKSVRQRLHS
jgi:uncharacterized protein (DUF1800 family)